MPGFSNADNKFGLTPFIVGQVLGDGCNYDTIQTAIDECFAAGGGVVGIRASTVPYVENLTLRSGVELNGYCVDGRLPSFIGNVVIEGNHTFTIAGGFGAVICQYLTFSAVVGDAITINTTGGGQAIFAIKFSGVEASTVPGQRAFVLNADIACTSQISTDNAQIQSDSHVIESIGAGSGSAFFSLGSANSNTGALFQVSNGTANLTGQKTQFAGNGILIGGAGSSSATLAHTDIFSSIESILFGAGGGNANITHCTINCGAVSGNWIDGPVGQLDFADIILAGSAISIGAAIIQGKINWQPYAETAVAAVGSNRGTSSYDSTQFNITDGWVQLVSPATPFTWVDQALSVIVNPNQGNFTTALITLTLPAVPAQGDVCKFKQITNDNINITANVGQIIQVGNVGGTNAASTSSGDSLELTYYAAGAIWMANSVIGNFSIS